MYLNPIRPLQIALWAYHLSIFGTDNALKHIALYVFVAKKKAEQAVTIKLLTLMLLRINDTDIIA